MLISISPKCKHPYIEQNKLSEQDNHYNLNEQDGEEHTPKLFSDEQNYQSGEYISDTNTNDEENSETQKLFDQDINNEEEDFEIPAFLRKQKF